MNSKVNVDLEKKRFLLHYEPSWFNEMMKFVNNRKIPDWLCIFLITLSAFLLAVVLNSSSLTNNPFQFSAVVYLTFIQITYTLYLINLLDQKAKKGLEEFKPILKLKTEDYHLIENRLTVLPAKIVNLITILTIFIFSVWWVLMNRFGRLISPESEFAQYVNIFSQNWIGIYSFIVFGFLWLFNLIFIYHTFYQLIAINIIYTRFSRVNIFQKQEIYAFSKVTATNAIGLILLSPLWIIFEGSSASMVINVVFSVIAIFIFVLPLRGVHKILKNQKEVLFKEISHEKEKVIRNILSLSNKNQFGPIKEVENMLSALGKTEIEIGKISTWPWQLDTIRKIIGALLVPIAIWLIQFFLNRLLNS